jgi:hypothetical protein
MIPLRRVIQVAHRGLETRASVEDDFHHFRLTLTHDGATIRGVTTEAIRQPYTLCGRAGEELKAALGLPLTPRALDVLQALDARQQCTHQFDLAAIAIAAAARREPIRYEAEVTDPGAEISQATLKRDGTTTLAWTVKNYAVVEPAPFEGRSLGAGFTDWCARRLDDRTAEAALALRRTVFISRGRRMQAELNRLGHAMGSGGCWVQQPHRAPTAARVADSVRVFDDPRAPPGEADRGWLSFDAG